MPEHIRNYEDRAYSKAEIQELLKWANPWVRTIILLFASTGMRSGAMPGLRLKHMTKLPDGPYRLILYAESLGKSVKLFTTPECAKAIDVYLEQRIRERDSLSPYSPLIRKEFSWRDANKFEPVSRNTIARLMEQAALRAGIRVKSGDKRRELMLCHAFRKHFTTSLKRARVDDLIRKMLTGHGIQSDAIDRGGDPNRLC